MTEMNKRKVEYKFNGKDKDTLLFQENILKMKLYKIYPGRNFFTRRRSKNFRPVIFGNSLGNMIQKYIKKVTK